MEGGGIIFLIECIGFRAGVHSTRTVDGYQSQPIRNQAAQQEVSSRPVSEASSVLSEASAILTAAPIVLPSPKDGTA